MTFLRELVEGFDRQWNITLKGEQIKNGDLAGVVSGVLDDLFANEEHLGDYCVYLVLAKEQLHLLTFSFVNFLVVKKYPRAHNPQKNPLLKVQLKHQPFHLSVTQIALVSIISIQVW